jgi:hypothetical protein
MTGMFLEKIECPNLSSKTALKMGMDNLTHKMDFFFADIFFGGIVKSTHLGVVAARTFFNRGTRGEKPFPRTSHRVFGTLKAATNF